MTFKKITTSNLLETLNEEDRKFYTSKKKKNSLSANFMFGYLKYVKGVAATKDFYDKFYDPETADLKSGARKYFAETYSEIIEATKVKTYTDSIIEKLGLGNAA